MTEPEAHTNPDEKARAQAALTLWLVNVLLGVLIGTAYLRHLPDTLSTRGWIFVVFGLVSSVGILGLIPAAISWLSLRLAKKSKTQGWIQAGSSACFLSLMMVDTVVYSLLRYHFFSSAVFNVAVTPGSEDAVHLGGHVWLPAIAIYSLLVGGEFLLWRHFLRRHLAAPKRRQIETLFSRPVALWGFVLLAVVGVEKSMYAAADLERDREVSYAADILPGYAPWRVSQLFPQQLEGEPAWFDDVELRPKGWPLAYPHAWPELEESGARPNVLILVVDSWRQDMLDAEVTPELFALSRTGRRFESHSSGGNGTRFGIFSMLYGLHGSYWFSALEERRPPVMLEVLAHAGYELMVYSSASMNFPEFRDCAWVDCSSSVHDDYPSEHAWERDLAVSESFREFLGERRAQREGGDEVQPFFSFVLLDAAHQPYDYPGVGPYQPAVEGLDYIELAHNQTPELVEGVFNRYRNALRFTDTVAADIINALRDSGELENTLVIVTGDHGDEFQENGFWGHTTNFTPEQVDVPMFLIGAGMEPGVEVRATSHLDIAPTVLEMMGANPQMRGQWCLGENLLHPPELRNLVVSGWEHVGVITPELIFRVRMGGRSSTDVSVYDKRWQPQNDADARIDANEDLLRRLSEECNRFLLGNGAQ